MVAFVKDAVHKPLSDQFETLARQLIDPDHPAEVSPKTVHRVQSALEWGEVNDLPPNLRDIARELDHRQKTTNSAD